MSHDNENLKELVTLLSLERLEENLFRGPSRDIGTDRVYGGQVLGQSIKAAQYTVEGRTVHSLHAYFLREGDHDVPIVYEVDRSRDGRSFSARRVVAIQHGRPIFTMSASFQVAEEGLDHHPDMPAVPGPEQLEDILVTNQQAIERAPLKLRRFMNISAPFEFRPVEKFHIGSAGRRRPWQHVWIRAADRLPDDFDLHRAMLAYVSDYGLLSTALVPHEVDLLSGKVQMVSVDHAMWFHRPFRMDQWLLYATEGISSSNSRGLSRGFFYRQDGTLAATAVQEGLMRILPG